MTAPNVHIGSLKKQLGDGNPDGVIFNSPERSNPAQSTVQGAALGVITGYNSNAGAAFTADTIVASNNTITTTGLATTDIILGVTKPTAQAGIGIAGIAASAADTTDIQFINPTAANVNTTANETYVVTALKGMNYHSANLVPTLITASKNEEQIFDLSGTGAVAAANITNGAVSEINVTTAGVGYSVPPTVIITRASTSSGANATAVAITSNNTVVGVRITDGGSGYDSAPTISFEGGPGITPGSVLVVNAALQANLGIGACRITGKDQVGITFINPAAANVTPTANATYKFMALNDMAAVSPLVSINGAMVDNTAVAANTSNETAVATPGILATDLFLGTSVAIDSPTGYAGGVTAANSFSFRYAAGVPGDTPANATYSFALMRHTPSALVEVNSIKLTPTSVAAATTAEQIFTLPTNVTIQAVSTVVVNKPTFTPGISVVGVRANSTSTVGITYMNSTTAAIVPPAECYLMANFPSTIPTLSATVTEGTCAQVCGISWKQIIDLQNELQQTLKLIGVIKGS